MTADPKRKPATWLSGYNGTRLTLANDHAKDGLFQFLNHVGYDLHSYSDILSVADSGSYDIKVKIQRSYGPLDVTISRSEYNNFMLNDYRSPKVDVSSLVAENKRNILDNIRKFLVRLDLVPVGTKVEQISYELNYDLGEPISWEVNVRMSITGLVKQFRFEQDAFEQLTQGKLQAPDGFQGFRNEPPPLGGEDMTAVRTWETVRDRVISIASEKPKYGRAPQISLGTDGKFTCTCGNDRDSVCAHVAAMFLQGRDRRDFLDRLSTSKPRHTVVIPIGLGRAFFTAYLKPLYDDAGAFSGEFSATSELDVDPRADPMIIGKHEGLLPYIKYIESNLRLLEQYRKLSDSDTTNAVAYINRACKHTARHSQSTYAHNTANLRSDFMDRDNFILGTVASLTAHKCCLPCYYLTTGLRDIPVV